jgi:adhesin transport system outer membrane protein
MRVKYRLRARLLAAVAAAGVLAVGAPVHAMTLEEAVRLAVETNPDVGAATGNRDAVEHELRQARSFYLPNLDLSGGIGRTVIDDRNTRNDGDGNDTVTNTRQEFDATLSQRLFDGFETDSQVAREKARLASAAYSVYEVAEFLALDAVNAYLEVLRQRQLVELAERNIQVHRDILGSLEERVEGGIGSTADISQTQARLARAQATLREREQGRRDAEAQFDRIVGQYPADLDMPEAPTDAVPGDARSVLDQVLDSNPTIRIREADVRAAEAEVDVAESNYYPTVTLNGEHIYTDGTDFADTYAVENRVMLRFTWNLYSGGRDTAARSEAVARVYEAKSERFRAVRQAREEVRVSWNAREAARQRVSDLSRAVEFNTQTRDAYREQFQVAQRTLLDVLDAENELFVSRGQLATAEVNAAFAEYRLMALTGRLLPTLGVSAPGAADPTPPSFGETLIPAAFRADGTRSSDGDTAD